VKKATTNSFDYMEDMTMKKRTRKKLTIPVAKPKVSNERLVQMLKARQYPLKELISMGVTEFQIMQLKKLNYMVTYQYDHTYNDFVYYILEKGEDPFIFLPSNGEKSLKIAKMADIHLGSNEVDEYEVISLLSYLWEEGYRIISISGDLTDGYGVYRGQIENLSYTTLEMQADVVVSILSLFDFLYIVNKGNHDASSTKNAGIDVLSMIEQKMVNRGKKFVYLKSYSGYIVYNNAAIQIIHMDGGRSAQSDTYANQKLMDSIFKTSPKVGKSNVNYVKIFDKMVPVVNVITGHYHTLAKFTYGNVIVESPLSTQHTTDFVNRRGLRSKTGARVSEMIIEDGKCISEKGAIIFGRDAYEIYSVENSGVLKELNHPRINKNAHKFGNHMNDDIDTEKINNAIKKLAQKGFCDKEELGLTDDEIEYINDKCNYNIYVNDDNVVVFKMEDDRNVIIYSPIEQKGIVKYLEVSNMLIGSKFFNEEAFRYMLDAAKERGIRHIHIGGNAIWGIPNRNDAENTKFFKGEQQVDEFVRILSDYPNFHYFTINGICEDSFIRCKSDEQRFDPMRNAEEKLTKKGIKFTAVNSSKCDFLIDGIVFRMVNNKKALKYPYTRDYDIVKEQRTLMAKQGNITKINGKEYSIGAIFYGYVPSTQETHSGGMYVTSTAGPTVDPDNTSKIVQANAECAIVHALVNHGEILKFEREVISPNV